MTTKRDKAILNDLNRFRVMDRDSIVQLHFKGLKKPENSANNVLKRLHRDGHIERSTYFQPYVYFPSDTKIKKQSQKIPHFLKILQIYKDMHQFEKPQTFLVEPKYGSKGTVEPDAFAIWKRQPFFIEAQCSVYSDEAMRKKLDRYEELFQSGSLINESWQPSKPIFPHVLIISDTRYGVDNDYSFKILQSQSINQFMSSLKSQQTKKENISNNTHQDKPPIKIKLG